MAIALFYSLWAVFTGGLIILFEVYSDLSLVNGLLFVLFVLLGWGLAFFVIVVHLLFYGRFKKEADPLDVKYHQHINKFLDLALHLMRLKVVATGKEDLPNEPFVFCGNHQSNYDILAIKSLLNAYPMIFIAKYTLFSWPIIGRLAKFLGNIAIHRESDRAAIEAIVEGVKAYKKGHVVAIFPEGKRSFSNTMDAFKPGAFKLAMKPKAPLVVGTIYNFHKAWRGWPFKRQVVRVHFHKPLYADDYSKMNTTELSNHVKTMIQTQLDRFEA